MNNMDAHQVEAVIRELCISLADEYAGYYIIQAGALAAEPCPNVVFHAKKAIYSALIGSSGTVVYEFESGKKLADISHINKNSLFSDQPYRSQILSPRQQERIEAAKYDENADLLQLVKEVEDSKELHLFAANWNWGDIRTARLLRSIIENPLCERGTALMLYWRTDGIFCQYHNRDDVPAWAVEMFDLAIEIENLMAKGAFHNHEIGFDPKNEKQLGGDYRLVLRNAKREIPPLMLEAAPGAPLMELF